MQNIMRTSLIADISDAASEDRVAVSMLYVQFVGPDLTLDSAFLIAERN